jgi:hypothetical protein
VDDKDGYFGERVAATYEESSAEMFEAGAVDPVADVLAEFAVGGPGTGARASTPRSPPATCGQLSWI